MDYGFLSAGTQQTMQNFFNQQFSCNPSTASCASSLSVSDILSASNTLYSQAIFLDQAAGQGEPMRPIRDGQLISNTLTTSTPFPQVSKPILVTTVANEAGPSIYGGFPSPMSESDYLGFVDWSLGTTRADTVLGNQRYTVQNVGGTSDARPSLEKMGTDYLWKCSSWTFSRTWASKGGPAYVGMYVLGATYPSNGGIPFCTSNGAVCHQDDIQIVFGTTNNPNTQQAQLTQEIQSRYKAFLTNGNPNVFGLAQWSTATSSSTNAILLGASGPAPVDACIPTFWGGTALYDYQVYGL